MDIKVVLNRLEGVDADLFVLKGFPVTTIQEVGKRYMLIDSDVYNEGKVVLENISAQKLLPFIFTSSGQMVCCCESFISLCNNFAKLDILGKKICVLENNLLISYPNPSNCDIPDFDNDEIEEVSTRIYSVYYSFAEKVKGKVYVQYIDNYSEDNPSIITIPLIPSKPMRNIVKASSKELPELTNYLIENTLSSFNEDGSLSLSDAYSINPKEINYERLEVLLGLGKLLGKEISLSKKAFHENITPRKELSLILKEVWGYESFRTLQVYEDLTIDRTIRNVPQNEIIETVIRESEKGLTGDSAKQINNILLTAPTGAGKSILFQLSAIYLAKTYKAMTIVISPLVALMDDQVEGLTGYKRVATLNSNRTGTEKTEIINRINKGEIDILYLSPEMLLAYSISVFIGSRRLGLIVIDEAHTVTTWGRDFRVDYLFLGDYIRKSRKILNYSFPIFALTATAVCDITRKNDMVYDTIKSLHMDPCLIYIGNVKRSNISFTFKESHISTNYEKKRRTLTIQRIKEAIYKKKKTIVYFPFKSTINTLLNSEEVADIKNLIASYHASLFQNQKNQNALDFKSGVKPIMVATKAYGMGVDVNDIEEVYHHAPSGNLADYVQEIGRIARDPNIHGVARLDFSTYDFTYKRRLQGLSNIRSYQLQEVLTKLMALFKMNGEKRNMLISASDFSYIFPSSKTDNLDQNVKSSLLLISNDLLNKLRFHSLIVRPKSLFSRCYVAVNTSEIPSFYKCYKKYVSKVASNVFYLYADKLWQDKFSHISFPMFKYYLGIGKIFKDFNVSLKAKIEVNLKNSIDETRTKMLEFFTLANGFIKYMATEHHRLPFEDMKAQLPRRWDNEKKDRFLETFKALYAIAPASDDNSDAYCSIKTQSKGGLKQSFQFLQAGYESVQTLYLKVFKDFFKKEDFTSYFDWKSDVYLVCEFLNSYGLADYQRFGGDEPMIAVRINNPNYLNSLLRKKNYQNAILNSIYEKQAYAERVFSYFFTTPMTDEERWEFIESYFLGVPEDRLLK